MAAVAENAVAYVEERRLAPNFQPEPHLWGQDLQSGEEKELFVAPPPNPPTSLEPNVVLTVLGWSNYPPVPLRGAVLLATFLPVFSVTYLVS
jgi:hypothetical protein